MLKPRLVGVFVLTVLASACTAGRAFRQGDEAARSGDWDTAVTYYSRAVQEKPGKAEYKIALERATQSAAREHLSRARELESGDQLDAALIEYKKAIDLDASNRLASARVVELERTIRDRIEASRPRPAIEKLREQARTQGVPLLDPASREPIRFTFNQASLKDILNFIGTQSGINITYDQTFADKPYSVQLDAPVEEALQQIMTANQLFYKVMNPKTIMVIPDTAAKHTQYDDLVVRVFFVSHADVTELTQILNTVMRIPTMPVQPTMLPNKTANTITVRATAAVVEVIERIIRANDKPRAEVVIDVQILEVNKKRTKELGLNLSSYSLGLTFSPEVGPGSSTSVPPFNLNTISQGVSTADFYLTVPTATIKFLENDAHTKLVAKPQLRGAEGTKLTLNLGDEIPVLQTVFGAAAPGGFASVPQSSFNYRPIGIILEMTPRVTYEGDIVLDAFSLESSALGPSISVGGQDAPSFSSRKVTTKLRLREGESTMLAGLLRDEQRKILTGFPGVSRIPILRSLFGQTSDEVNQSDIVMLLTPHVVRTHELTATDIAPIFIGTQQNVGLGGPPPLIATVQPETSVAAAPTAAALPVAAGVPGIQPGQPGGGAAVPGVQTPQRPIVTGEGGTPPAARPPGAGAVPGTAPTTPGAIPPPTAPGLGAPTTPNTPPPPGTAPVTPPRDPAAPPPLMPGAPPATAAQIIVTSGPEFRIAGGPYTVPLSINNASRISTVSLSVTFNPGVLRVRTVQDGTFMRQGGATVTFTPRIDAATGRVDIAVTRTADQAGASGTGLLAALLFDAVGPGSSTIQVNGVANTPEGQPIPLQFTPVTVTVR